MIEEGTDFGVPEIPGSELGEEELVPQRHIMPQQEQQEHHQEYQVHQEQHQEQQQKQHQEHQQEQQQKHQQDHQEHQQEQQQHQQEQQEHQEQQQDQQQDHQEHQQEHQQHQQDQQEHQEQQQDQQQEHQQDHKHEVIQNNQEQRQEQEQEQEVVLATPTKKRKSSIGKGSRRSEGGPVMVPEYYKSIDRKYCTCITDIDPSIEEGGTGEDKRFFWEIESFVQARKKPDGVTHKDYRAFKSCENKSCKTKTSFKRRELDMTQKYMLNGHETFCCVDTSAEPNMEAGQGMMTVTDEHGNVVQVPMQAEQYPGQVQQQMQMEGHVPLEDELESAESVLEQQALNQLAELPPPDLPQAGMMQGMQMQGQMQGQGPSMDQMGHMDQQSIHEVQHALIQAEHQQHQHSQMMQSPEQGSQGSPQPSAKKARGPGVLRKNREEGLQAEYYKSNVRKYCTCPTEKDETGEDKRYFWEEDSFVQDRKKPDGTTHKDFRAYKSCENKNCRAKVSFKREQLDMTNRYHLVGSDTFRCVNPEGQISMDQTMDQTMDQMNHDQLNPDQMNPDQIGQMEQQSIQEVQVQVQVQE